MLAAVVKNYGSPNNVSVEEIPIPEPEKHQVLIRVYASTVSAGDQRIRSLQMPFGFKTHGRLALGWSRPRQAVLGSDLSGIVVALGSAVTQFRVGDEVIASSGAKLACHAELCLIAESGVITHKPRNWSHIEAASLVFGGSSALFFLNRIQPEPGKRVLINGASGAVGAAFVQLAKQAGMHVTGITSSRNSKLVYSLGADSVIEYDQSSYLDAGLRWHFVIDTVGNMTVDQAKRVLLSDGCFVDLCPSLPQLLICPLLNVFSKVHVIRSVAIETKADLQELVAKAESGAIKPLIDSTFPLSEIAQAHARVDTRRKVGSVVIFNDQALVSDPIGCVALS